MTGPQLEVAGQRWEAEAFAREVSARASELNDRLTADQRVFQFVAPISAETVWTFHALQVMGIVALPMPSTSSESLTTAYKAAVSQPPAPDAQLRLLTSGSSGRPKVVDLSASQLQASVEASHTRLSCTASDRWLCCLPLHHIAGISVLLRTAHAGATAVLQPCFDPAAVNDAIENQAITMVSLVPTMLKRVLDNRNDRPFPASLRVVLLGGAPASSELIDRCRAIAAPVALTWGMTETGSQVATRAPGDLRPEPDVGLPLPGQAVSVEDGFLVVTGPIAPGGRIVTSDRGRIDAEGRVVVLGRGPSFIISGGENVDPSRVEAILVLHPSIQEAAVFGIDDEHWGQRVEAAIVGTPNTDVSEYLRDALEPHERPKRLHWVERLPRTQLGKVDRGALLRQYSD